MEDAVFRIQLNMPAQGAAEPEATIIEWHVAQGDDFEKGQALAQIDSAKSIFDFEAPCAGKVIQLLHQDGETVPFTDPVIEIETADEAMKDWRPDAPAEEAAEIAPAVAAAAVSTTPTAETVSLLGITGYLPERVVPNSELAAGFPEITADYIYQVTGIRERRWAADDEKPSDLAYAAALESIRKARVDVNEIDAIILATTTPDAAMPSTACILSQRLNLPGVPAFDLNAACSGWLYAVCMAEGMIRSGMARNVLTVAVDMQSRLLDKTERSALFIFGDGAGAAVVTAGSDGHPIRAASLGADANGLRLARREAPGYVVTNGKCDFDPWIRMDGPGMFRLATDAFAKIVLDISGQVGWTMDDTRWVVPHQANARILKAAARRAKIAPEKFFMNVEKIGNTSAASIPISLAELEDQLERGDKLILCSVGAGVTTGAAAIEW